jgi:hypothetical protein
MPSAFNTEAERNKRNKQCSGGERIERHGACSLKKKPNAIAQPRASSHVGCSNLFGLT